MEEEHKDLRREGVNEMKDEKKSSCRKAPTAKEEGKVVWYLWAEAIQARSDGSFTSTVYKQENGLWNKPKD